MSNLETAWPYICSQKEHLTPIYTLGGGHQKDAKNVLLLEC